MTPALAPTLQQQERPGGRGGGPREENDSDGPREYSEVITEDAITSTGMFDVHEVGDDLFFEIPPSELENEMLLIQRTMESTLQKGIKHLVRNQKTLFRKKSSIKRCKSNGKRETCIAGSSGAFF
jgi:hypothetical protein